MSYERTLSALRDYDREPTSGNGDLVNVSFWLEAPTHMRGKFPNPTLNQIRAIVKLANEHDWQFYGNGTFCRKCGAGIGSGFSCR